MTGANRIRIHSQHTPSTTLMYELCAHEVIPAAGDWPAEEKAINFPYEWLRRIGAIRADEPVGGMTQAAAKRLAREINTRIETAIQTA